MSLRNMVEKQNMETIVLELTTLNSNNSKFPVSVWFDRDRAHAHGPRIKVQQYKGDNDTKSFLSVDAINYNVVESTRHKEKKGSLPDTSINTVIDFLHDNQPLIDKYYGITRDPDNGAATINKSSEMKEEDFRKQIIPKAKEFSKNHKF